MVWEETVEQGETVAAQDWAEMVLLHSSERCKEQESSNLTQNCNCFEMFWWNRFSYPLKLVMRRTKQNYDPWSIMEKKKKTKDKMPNCCFMPAPGLSRTEESSSWMYFLMTHIIGMCVLADFIILTISIKISFRETVHLRMQMCYIRLVMHMCQLFQQQRGEK